MLVLVVGVLLFMQSTDFKSNKGIDSSLSSVFLPNLLITLGDLDSPRKGESDALGVIAGTKLTEW